MGTRELKLGFWYWFWYGYVWFAIALIPGVIILSVVAGIEPMMIAKAAWVIPVGLWWGFRELKRKKTEAIQKYFTKQN